jgi:hypothetical protein
MCVCTPNQQPTTNCSFLLQKKHYHVNCSVRENLSNNRKMNFCKSQLHKIQLACLLAPFISLFNQSHTHSIMTRQRSALRIRTTEYHTARHRSGVQSRVNCFFMDSFRGRRRRGALLLFLFVFVFVFWP